MRLCWLAGRLNASDVTITCWMMYTRLHVTALKCINKIWRHIIMCERNIRYTCYGYRVILIYERDLPIAWVENHHLHHNYAWLFAWWRHTRTRAFYNGFVIIIHYICIAIRSSTHIRTKHAKVSFIWCRLPNSLFARFSLDVGRAKILFSPYKSSWNPSSITRQCHRLHI